MKVPSAVVKPALPTVLHHGVSRCFRVQYESNTPSVVRYRSEGLLVSPLLVSALQGGENAQLPLYWSCWKRECDYDVYLSLPVYLCRRAGGLRSGKEMVSLWPG